MACPTENAHNLLLLGILFGLFTLFGLAAFPLRFEPLFTALGAIGGALHQLGTDQFDHGLLRAIALARSKPRDAGVATIALTEAGAQGIEQLLDRSRRQQERRRLAARVQRIQSWQE